MSDDTRDGGNPLTEGIGGAARHATEVAAVLAMGAQAAIRARAHRLDDSATRDRAVAGTDHVAARLVWSAATQPGFSTAAGHDAARVWSAAAPWAGTDPAAADAARRAEARLTEVVPDLMGSYQRLVADGRDPAEAMHQSGAAALAWAAAGHERVAAAADAATPDVPATRPDEHHQGLVTGEGHAARADSEAARAASLAAVAYPQPAAAALTGRPSPPAARPATTARRVPTPRRGR